MDILIESCFESCFGVPGAFTISFTASRSPSSTTQTSTSSPFYFYSVYCPEQGFLPLICSGEVAFSGAGSCSSSFFFGEFLSSSVPPLRLGPVYATFLLDILKAFLNLSNAANVFFLWYLPVLGPDSSSCLGFGSDYYFYNFSQRNPPYPPGVRACD